MFENLKIDNMKKRDEEEVTMLLYVSLIKQGH